MPSKRHVLLGWLLCGAMGGTAAAPATPVTLVPVQRLEWPETIAAHGVIAAWQELWVSSRQPGLGVVELGAEPGDRVRRGQLLVRLDDRGLRAELDKAEAEQARSLTLLKQAQAERQRILGLQEQQLVSEQAVLQAQTQLELAQAQQRAAGALMQGLRVRLQDTRLLAPEDGVVSARAAALGQVPAVGAELFRLIRHGRLEWRAELDAAQMARLPPRAAVQLQLPDGRSLPGRVRQLAATLEPSSRLGRVHVDLAPDSSVRAGMVAAGQFELPRRTVLVVPAAALVLRDGRSLVYRVQQGRAQAVPVVAGQRHGEAVAVDGALQAGEAVVVQGAGFLREGEPVRAVQGARAVQP